MVGLAATLALAGCELAPPTPLVAPPASAPPRSPAPPATASAAPSPSPTGSVTATASPATPPVHLLPPVAVRPPINFRTLSVYRDNRQLFTKVWYPVQPGRYPIVLFGHGLTAVPDVYNELLTRIAAAGFVVAAPTFPHTNYSAADYDILDVVNQPEDMSAVLDALIALPSTDPLRQVIDPERVAAAGHSAGAITALGMFSNDGPQRRDDRIDAALILAGSSLGMGENFAGPDAPFLFIHAQSDPVVPYWTARSAYRALPWPKGFLTLTGDEHVEPYLLPTDAQFGTVVNASIEFLWWALYDDADGLARLLTSPALEQNYPVAGG